jgi:uncharacterized protein
MRSCAALASQSVIAPRADARAGWPTVAPAAQTSSNVRCTVGGASGCTIMRRAPLSLMTPPSITNITLAELEASPSLRAALLALNNDHALELSWADDARLRSLVAIAFLAERAGFADALLIAFDQDARYDSPNFLWFRNRYARFVYVDRIVTAPEARGRGLARKLYGRVIERAVTANHERIVCEVNVDPPNPGSQALHGSLGFVPVGDARLPTGKTVTYLELKLRSGYKA